MRIKLLIILALPFVLASCLKSDSDTGCNLTLSTATAPAAEVTQLQAYLTTNNITATQHSSGIFYVINNPGEGVVPVACSAVMVKYVGRLTTGTVFDNSNINNPNGLTFTLGQLIAGWQIGIPLIKKGGSITLYIPPSLGYGSSGSGSAVPPNANLIFEIELVNVQ